MHIRDVKDDELMEKYKKSIKLAERITRYLKGDLSEAEMLVLKKSLKESSDGEQLLTKIRDQKNIAAKQVLYDSFDAKKKLGANSKGNRKKSPQANLPYVLVCGNTDIAFDGGYSCLVC